MKVSLKNENELNLQIEKFQHARQEEKYLSEEKLFIALRKEYFNLLIQQRLKKIKGLESEKEEVEKELKHLGEEGVGLDLLFNKQQELLQEKEKLKSQILERLESLREELRSLEQQIYFHLTEARQREKNKLLNREALNELEPKLALLRKNVEDLRNNPLYHETLDELEEKEKEFQKKVSEFRIRKDSYNEQINQLKQEWSRLETSIEYLTEELTSIDLGKFSDFSSTELVQQIESKIQRQPFRRKPKIYQREQLKEADRKKALLVKIEMVSVNMNQRKIDQKNSRPVQNLIQKGYERFMH